MSERYWISGVQLGLFVTLEHKAARESLLKEIVKKQFLGNKEELKKKRLEKNEWF